MELSGLETRKRKLERLLDDHYSGAAPYGQITLQRIQNELKDVENRIIEMNRPPRLEEKVKETPLKT
jgi:hypothetical protein